MYCKAAIPDGGGGAKTFVIKPGPDGVFLAKVVDFSDGGGGAKTLS